jgi:hypothetical protein
MRISRIQFVKIRAIRVIESMFHPWLKNRPAWLTTGDGDCFIK